ncbi:MAG TPA: acyl-CoA dehydrogenase [Chloroflexi bacterium]|nr:acyl-CoA dehydrogenase [Chloroflexota bacterium]
MDFTLSEEHVMFRNMFRDFAQNEVAPLAQTTDHEEKPPLEVLQKLAEQGFLGATFPEDYGGAELDALGYCLLMEELAKACMSTALTVHVHLGLAGNTILREGTEEQKEKYLPDMADGVKIGAFALTEPQAGTDAAAICTVAVRDGDEYVLTGNKIWVSNAGIADVFIVFAKTDPEAGARGISAFIVEKDFPGFKVGRRERLLGLRGAVCNPIYLDGCRVPAENLLGGKEGEGFKVAMKALDFARLSVAAICLGLAEAALKEGAKFATEREQFGGPIAQKQAIQNYVADAAIKIEALRHMVEYVAWLADSGERYTKEAAMVKAFGAEVAFWVANKMVQVHGGYGYMREYAIERMYRDARALHIIDGTTEIQKFIVAADIFKEYGLKIKP